VATYDGVINISLSELLHSDSSIRGVWAVYFTSPSLFEVRTFHIDCIRPTCTTAYNCWNASSSAVDRQS